jgi:hypothetical protein
MEKDEREIERKDNIERFIYNIMIDINGIKEIIKEQKKNTENKQKEFDFFDYNNEG